MEPTPAPSDREELDRAKTLVRFRARAGRRTVLPEMRTAHAYAIAERILHLPEIADAATVMLYGASPEEADPSVLEAALRDLGKRIAYPRVAGGHDLSIHWVDDPGVLVVGAFELMQPEEDVPIAPLGQIGAIVVPGVAFECMTITAFGRAVEITFHATCSGVAVSFQSCGSTVHSAWRIPAWAMYALAGPPRLPPGARIQVGRTPAMPAIAWFVPSISQAATSGCAVLRLTCQYV